MTGIREWLEVPVAAKFFGLSHWTIRTWANRRVIRRDTVDGQVLVHTGDLAKRIAELRTATEKAAEAWRPPPDIEKAG